MKALRTFVPLLFSLIVATWAHALAPRNGFWIAPNQPGNGYVIEVQNNTVFFTAYSYDANTGSPTWFTATGTLDATGTLVTATVTQTAGGNCLGCPYRPVSALTPVGSLSILFTDGKTGVIRYPNGFQRNIVAFDFGTGDIPDGYLGSWVMYWLQGPSTTNPTFETRFIQILTTSTNTSNGNPLAAGVTSRNTLWGYEYQRAGQLAGYTVAVEATSTGSVLNSFIVDLNRDTVEGAWVNLNSSTLTQQFTSQAYRVISRAGTQIRSFAGLPTRKAATVAAVPASERRPVADAIASLPAAQLAEHLKLIASQSARAVQEWQAAIEAHPAQQSEGVR
jgi:hypothetical protein